MEQEELTEKIIGCCFAVHRELGAGFPEKIYQNALQLSLKKAGVSAEAKRRVRVSFQGVRVGDFEMDLVAEGSIVIEVKAVSWMLPRLFGAQLISYLKAAGLPVGLLVNFGNLSCQVKRFVL